MNEQPHIDYDGLAAFIAGELSEEDQLLWNEWIEESPENQRIYQECLLLFEPEETTESTEVFDSMAAWENVRLRIESGEVPLKRDNIRRLPQQWWRAAAAIIIGGALITFLIQQFQGNTITITQETGVAQYVLPDSSLVTLNGKAELSYTKEYNQENRDVSLSGKAYFDVRKNDSLQFNVSTQRGYLSVLGTAFVIEETTDSLYVVVERGTVRVGLKSNNNRLELTQNETGTIQFEDGRTTESQVESLNSLYWANRKLSYRQESLDQVMNELARIFNKNIQYDPEKLSDCRITAIFRDQSFEEIMENIALSLPLEYTINGDLVQIRSDGCGSQ